MSGNRSKDKDTSTKELMANVWFALKYIYKANEGIVFVRVPLLILQTLLALLPTLFMRRILNELSTGDSIKAVLVLVMIMGGSICVTKLMTLLLDYYDRLQMEKTLYWIKRNLGEAIMRLPYHSLESPDVRNFISLAEKNSFQELLTGVTRLLGAIISMLSYAAIICTIHPLILVFFVVVVVFKTMIDKKKRAIQYKVRGVYAPIMRKMAYYSDVVNGMEYGKEVRVNALETWIFDKYQSTYKKEYEPMLKENTKINLRLEIFVKLSAIVQNAVIYIFLAYKVIFGGMLIGDFSLYLTSANNFANNIAGVIENISALMNYGMFAKEFRYFIEESKKKGIVSEGPVVRSEGKVDSIVFYNVSFRYPGTDKMILKQINLEIRTGESLSIVGINGAGKTTLIKLLCRFYQPTEGEIRVNGIPIDQIPLEDYNHIIAAVFQDYKLFSFSVRENIQMDTVGDNEKLCDVIAKSGLTEKMEQLADGPDTYVFKEFDENGVEFSGGEGQKLAIARALYKDTPIVILDEPTSALDPIAEYDIFKRFRDLTKGRTSIYISHRLSSTRFTDKIAVLEDGEMKEYGTHEELLKHSNGIYRNMFELQAEYYT